MTRRTKHIVAGIVTVMIALLLSVPLSGTFDALEEGLLGAKYRIRGESPADSSIVIVYFDNDAILSLGGVPLKRNYYALVIEALHDFGAKVIGLDIGLSASDPEHPEYDHLLASIVRRAGNVVVSGYFQSLSADSGPGQESRNAIALDAFADYPAPPFPVRQGRRLEAPYTELLASAEGFGHTNLTDDLNVPLLIRAGTGRYVPCFAYAVADAALHPKGAGGDRVRTSDLWEIGAGTDGDARLNYPGGPRSLRTISAVNMLKAFDSLGSGGGRRAMQEAIRGKIVLVSFIAQGRSPFIETPYAPQFPSVGVHATFIHNLLHRNFLRQSPAWTGYLLALLCGLLSALLMFARREVIGLAGIGVILLAAAALSFLLFDSAALLLPLARPAFAVVFVVLGLLVYRHRAAQREVFSLSGEMERITRELQNKELILKTLEEELSVSTTRDVREQEATLLEEVRRHKQEIQQLRLRADDLKPFVQEEHASASGGAQNFSGIIYSASGPMAGVVGFIRKIADNDATVLVLGESGTGKELVARALHDHSHRKGRAFIAVNCGALSETLLESELFGHEKGSFTGAVREKQGRFELADGGTIFLDEIAETSEAFQIKLLRILQEGTFERVGGTETKRVNVRVIAATNSDLAQAVERKKFRGDLFYRLNVLSIQLPPLRERREDIPLLVDYLTSQESPSIKNSAAAVQALQQYDWRGNVRELQSAVKRAVLLAKAEGREIIRLSDYREEIASSTRSALDLEEQIIGSLREMEFSRSAISDTADGLGGLHRGTVAEYFRGYCFKIVVEKNFDQAAAARAIAGNDREEILEKVQKKLNEYIGNAVELVSPGMSTGAALENSRPKYKNLPQRYHPYLDSIIGYYSRKK